MYDRDAVLAMSASSDVLISMLRFLWGFMFSLVGFHVFPLLFRLILLWREARKGGPPTCYNRWLGGQDESIIDQQAPHCE